MIRRTGIGMRDQKKERETKEIRIVEECRNKGKSSFFIEILQCIFQSLL